MLFQEIEANYLVPAIRKKIVNMLNEKGYSGREIASKLHITTAAVSQYLSGKRGRDFYLPKGLLTECMENVIDGKDISVEIQNVIRKLKDDGEICRIYKINNLRPEDCKYCEKHEN